MTNQNLDPRCKLTSVSRHLLIATSISAALLVASCSNDDIEQQQEREIKSAQDKAQEDGQGNEPDSGEAGTTSVERMLRDFSLIFQDEFNGGTVDADKWNTAYNWGPDFVVNSELQYYVDTLQQPDFGYNPFVFNGETLKITARQTPQDMLESSNQQQYQSGVLTSEDKFGFTYGYIEIRAKLPQGRGLWSGFWLLPAELTGLRPELYAMEARGDNNSAVFHRYNYVDSNGESQLSSLLRSPGQNLDQEFHTYGVNWEPQRLTFFVDGEPTNTIENGNISSQVMYPILNLAVGGWFPDEPNENTLFPASFEIDYLRVYQAN